MRSEVQSPTDGVATLRSLIGIGGITRSGLRKILCKLGKGRLGLESTDLVVANAAFFEGVKHVERMPLKTRGYFDWEMLHPCRLFAALVRDCPRLAELVAVVAASQGDTEWRLIIGCDEYTPGDMKRPESARKCMNVVFTFLNFGAQNLCHEALWCVPVSVRSERIAAIEGGWSRMFTQFLHLFLWGPSGIETAGIALMLNGAPYVLKAKLATCIVDGLGLSQVLEWRGASSMRPCFYHGNVLRRNCRLSEAAGAAFV